MFSYKDCSDRTFGVLIVAAKAIKKRGVVYTEQHKDKVAGVIEIE